ncbi:BREX-1 system adenine-specific DNA-methyltransferase PglX, partial [Neobacillus niacini]|uniref:BREX-1 system adenine-specific DNA-methyltransferase PglX n=1 Tax=Neobacillus niacini TaxID=86668 RepID=UPI002FFDA30B
INVDYDKYLLRIETLDETQLTIETFNAFNQLDDVSALLHQAKILTDSYDLVITNPPYMSSKGMNIKLSTYIKKYFSNFKSDLFSTFIARTSLLLKPNGFKSMITMQSWLFLSSHEKLRQYILTNEVFYNLIQIGYNSFPEMNSQVAHAASFITRNYKNNNYKGIFINLNNEPITADKGKVLKKRIGEQDFYYKSTSDFKKLPRMIIGYWLSEKMSRIFTKYPTIGEISDIKQGMTTSDNDRFLRLWFEVNKETIGFGIPNREKAKQTNFKWFPYNKGGPFRKWYGNNEYIVNFQNDGEELRSFHDVLNKTNPGGRIKNQDFYFLEGITYTFLSSRIGVRYSPEGSIFDVAGSSMFPNKSDLLYLLGYLCSNLTVELLKVINPTINIQVGDIRVLPVKIIEDKNKLNELVTNCIKISKNDWDSHEKSWGFKTHPLIKLKCGLSLNKAYKLFEDYSHSQIDHLLLYEKEINEIFNKMFDVEDEIPSVVPRDEVRLIIPRRYDCTTSLLSYFIGCLMGRYSLDCEGLTFAGGEWDKTKYKTFKPNKYGLIQFTDEYYFEEDIIVRLREFLTLIFGSEIVDENIQWLAESLELKRSESAEERLRRYFLDEFFIDHCQVYQKRPIYWLVDSGKQKGLRTLIYMHRYQPDTIATIRFEHLQEIQAKYHYEISDVDARIVNPNLSATEKRELEKRKTDFQKRLDELLEFDKKLAEYANAQISIDLDDGVNVNYQKFDKVLAKIK